MTDYQALQHAFGIVASSGNYMVLSLAFAIGLGFFAALRRGGWL